MVTSEQDDLKPVTVGLDYPTLRKRKVTMYVSGYISAFCCDLRRRSLINVFCHIFVARTSLRLYVIRYAPE